MRSPSDILEERHKKMDLSEFFRGPRCVYCGGEIEEKESYITFHHCSSTYPYQNYAHIECAKRCGWKIQEG